MNKLLVLSNNSASLSESNGRIHSYYVEDYINNNSLYNFYVRGNPDIPNVNYISVSPKKALLSKLTLGLLKPKPILGVVEQVTGTVPAKASNKSNKPLFHLLRSFAYFHNIGMNRLLDKYIKDNDIKEIMIWGTNIPFIYKYGYRLAKKHHIDLITFTGEDYPLKDYNYMTKHKSFLYMCLQHSLRKWATKAYRYSIKNIYAHDDLRSLYEAKMGISGGIVKLFESRCKKINKPTSKHIKRILYGGNLYIERAKSIVDVANYIEKYKDVYIDVYGSASKEVEELFNKHSNIHYHCSLPYEQLLKEIENADMLLHVEGFSPYYIKDCRYAFSTKISDYLAFGLPFFAYGPIEISGIKYLYEKQPDMVAINKDELIKFEVAYGKWC